MLWMLKNQVYCATMQGQLISTIACYAITAGEKKLKIYKSVGKKASNS